MFILTHDQIGVSIRNKFTIRKHRDVLYYSPSGR